MSTLTVQFRNELQIKLASVKLAMKYMKRVSAELKLVTGVSEEVERIVGGVKFAYRVHQVNQKFLQAINVSNT